MTSRTGASSHWWPSSAVAPARVAFSSAADERTHGRAVEVRVDAWVSLNARPAVRLIDRSVDVAAQPRDPWTDDWILPAPA